MPHIPRFNTAPVPSYMPLRGDGVAIVEFIVSTMPGAAGAEWRRRILSAGVSKRESDRTFTEKYFNGTDKDTTDYTTTTDTTKRGPQPRSRIRPLLTPAKPGSDNGHAQNVQTIRETALLRSTNSGEAGSSPEQSAG